MGAPTQMIMSSKCHTHRTTPPLQFSSRLHEMRVDMIAAIGIRALAEAAKASKMATAHQIAPVWYARFIGLISRTHSLSWQWKRDKQRNGRPALSFLYKSNSQVTHQLRGNLSLADQHLAQRMISRADHSNQSCPKRGMTLQWLH